LTRIMLNVIRDEVVGAQWTKRHDQPVLWAVVTRLQFAF